jgi:HEAT repeat protein
LLPVLERLTDDNNEVVAEAAVWALNEIAPQKVSDTFRPAIRFSV